MERRAFLTGLLGIAGAAAFAGAAQALPLARTLEHRPEIGVDDISEAMNGGATPDGTPVEKAQVSVQIGPRPRGRYYRGRRYRRGPRWRTVCRTTRYRGRLVRRCRRVRVW